MKSPKHYFLTLLLIAGSFAVANAQQKTLAIGTAAPNPNAALHVESPTNNQGMIIPRLTTAQRSSFTGALTAADVGLIVFDSDLRALTIWNGTAWDVGMKAGEPISINNAAATGSAAILENSNVTNTSPALSITTAGGGNAITANAPIQASSFIGDGSGLTGIEGGLSLPFSGVTPTAGNTFDLTSTALTGNVARFTTNNASNTNPTLVASTDGTGEVALFSRSSGSTTPTMAAVNSGLGSGGAGSFEVTNAANTGAALRATTTGTGSAGFFQITNSSNTNPSIVATSAGDLAFSAINSGTGTTASIFNTASNPSDVLVVTSQGTGTSGYFRNLNASNVNQTLRVESNGLGSIATINASNASNTATALNISHAGTGNAITANRPIQATQFIGDGSLLTGLAGFTLPRTDSIVTATGTPDLFSLKYNNAETKRILRVENLHQTNTGSAVSISNNGSGLGLYVQNVNDTSSVSTVFVANNSNNSTATPGPAGLYSEATGVGGTPGSFRIINPASERAALFAETLGVGPSFSARQSGTDGHASYFWVSDATNFGNPVRAQTDGTGSAVRLEVTNPANTSAALQINHAGTGEAINAVKTTNGSVANFQNVDPTNSYNVIELTTNGNGYALNASSSGNQRVAYFTLSNATSTAPAVSITSDALVQALEVFGSGQGRAATFQADGAAEAIQVRTDGVNSKAAAFLVTSASNAQPVIQSVSNGTGPALELSQTNGGLALDLASGGFKYSVFTVATLPATLTEKAGVVNVTASSGTLTFSNTGRIEGETILVVGSGPGIMVNGLGSGGIYQANINANDIKTFIFVNGYWVTQGMYPP